MWLEVLLTVVVGILLWLCTNQRYKWIYRACKTFPRDIKITILYFKIYFLGKSVQKEKLSVSAAFDLVVKREPQKIALYYEEEKWTFAQLHQFSYKITRYFANEGYAKGDTIALLMENCPEYPCVFLGLSRIGVVTALINSNLVKDPLVHSITVVNPKGLIVGSSCKKAIQEIFPQLPDLKIFEYKRTEDDSEILQNCVNLKMELQDVSGSPMETSYKPEPVEPIVYIYTSGTTGLPKASVLTQLRFILGAKTFALVCNITNTDVLYTPLPLYHTAGGMLGMGQVLVTGIPVVIRKKFSATNYFVDCTKFNVTVCQYIGEMCRYILASSENQTKTRHKVRLMVGNGLNPKIWKTFVTKFNIPKVVEVYGATEGVSNFVNLDNKIGSVGYIPWFLEGIHTISLLKCDETGQLIKNAKGRYIGCGIGEKGVAIGKIDPSTAVLRFDGYTDKQATEKKILHDVFKKSDMYFNSGDILISDEYRYYYFVDRTGDTFRWKGENVSTNEVEAVISNIVELADVVVYGVEIPFTEGRAGMASIMDPYKTLNIETLGNVLKSNLPSYALPIFIRILDSIPVTGTYKLKKTELRNDGYNLDKIKDKIYFLDPKLGRYANFDKTQYENIKSGSVRL